ncbi:MAG: DnaD domain protein [Clostridia bacterium]|nr:DnaD domain protein [Clostridia bacterium]
MKLIFICAPYSRLDENYYKSINYCRYVVEKGFIPINPITMYHDVLDERVPNEYSILSEVNKKLISLCDEVWVFGNASESLIADAVAVGKPVNYVKEVFNRRNSSETLSVIMRTWEAKTGKCVNRAIMENVIFYLNEGLTDKLIIEAIKKTALKSAGWNYLEGILRSCLRQGITTSEEFLNSNPMKKEENNIAAYDLDLFEKMMNKKD